MDEEELKAEARRKAEADIRDLGPGRRHTVFTDGLGALGVGWTPDGPAAVKQAEYDRVVFGETELVRVTCHDCGGSGILNDADCDYCEGWGYYGGGRSQT